MIKIPVAQLDNAGIELSGIEPPSFVDIDNDLISFSHQVRFSIHASLVNNGILLKGSVSTIMSGTCGRCLEEFETEITNNDICRFYEKATESEIDVTDDIREELILHIPQNPVCSETCEGLCSQCGANLNNDPCDCSKNGEENEIWKDLDAFKS